MYTPPFITNRTFTGPIPHLPGCVYLDCIFHRPWFLGSGSITFIRCSFFKGVTFPGTITDIRCEHTTHVG